MELLVVREVKSLMGLKFKKEYVQESVTRDKYIYIYYPV